MKWLVSLLTAVLLIIAAVTEAHDEEIVYTTSESPSAPTLPDDWSPTPWRIPSGIVLPVEDDTHYQGFAGRWVTVCATAYTPTNSIDGDYHATKGAYRWKTADGRTDVRRVPYGLAVPLQRRSDKKIPVWGFGTRVIIPTGYSYLDRSRSSERVFTVDDTSASKKYFYSKQGCLHVDMRFVDDADAFTWTGPLGYRFIKIFVIEE